MIVTLLVSLTQLALYSFIYCARILLPDGYVIFRESHLYPSCNVDKADNDPTIFRTLEVSQDTYRL